ncbi:MAG TPA: hypothetical protein VF666_13630 [Pyrinomonadaceae bacterium]
MLFVAKRFGHVQRDGAESFLAANMPLSPFSTIIVRLPKAVEIPPNLFQFQRRQFWFNVWTTNRLPVVDGVCFGSSEIGRARTQARAGEWHLLAVVAG